MVTGNNMEILRPEAIPGFGGQAQMPDCIKVACEYMKIMHLIILVVKQQYNLVGV